MRESRICATATQIDDCTCLSDNGLCLLKGHSTDFTTEALLVRRLTNGALKTVALGNVFFGFGGTLQSLRK